MLEILLYVSASRLPHARAWEEIDRILARARSHNPEHGITGGLIYTIGHFAQVLEGSKPELDALMESISADQRHEDVKVVTRRSSKERLFSRWAMAYAGEAYFMDKQVRDVFERTATSGREQQIAAEKLITFTRQFVDSKPRLDAPVAVSTNRSRAANANR